MKYIFLAVIYIFCFTILCAQNTDKEIKHVKIGMKTIFDHNLGTRDTIFIIEPVKIIDEKKIRFHPVNIDKKFKSPVAYFIPRANLLFNIPDSITIEQNNKKYLLFDVDETSVEFPINDRDKSKDSYYYFSAYIIKARAMAEGESSPVIIIKRR